MTTARVVATEEMLVAVCSKPSVCGSTGSMWMRDHVINW